MELYACHAVHRIFVLPGLKASDPKKPLFRMHGAGLLHTTAVETLGDAFNTSTIDLVLENRPCDRCATGCLPLTKPEGSVSDRQDRLQMLLTSLDECAMIAKANLAVHDKLPTTIKLSTYQDSALDLQTFLQRSQSCNAQDKDLRSQLADCSHRPLLLANGWVCRAHEILQVSGPLIHVDFCLDVAEKAMAQGKAHVGAVSELVQRLQTRAPTFTLADRSLTSTLEYEMEEL